MPEFTLHLSHHTPGMEALAQSAYALGERGVYAQRSESPDRIKLRCSGRALSRLLARYPDAVVDVAYCTSIGCRLRRVRGGRFVSVSALVVMDATTDHPRLFLRGDGAARGAFLADLHYLRGRHGRTHPAAQLRKLMLRAEPHGDDIVLVLRNSPSVAELLDLAEAYGDLMIGLVRVACS